MPVGGSRTCPSASTMRLLRVLSPFVMAILRDGTVAG
jgi:hypothetical protein